MKKVISNKVDLLAFKTFNGLSKDLKVLNRRKKMFKKSKTHITS